MINLTPGTFSIVPIKSMFGLHPYQQVIYTWLCHHANSDGISWPSLSLLSQETNIGKTSLVKHISELVKKEFLIKSTRKVNESNIYKVVVQDTHHCVSNCETPVVREVVTNYNHITKTKEHKCSSLDERSLLDESFEKFWEIYPRTTNRKGAYASWKKVYKDSGTILADIKHRKTTEGADCWLNKDKSYVPMPTTYLNQERWKDKEPVKIKEIPKETVPLPLDIKEMIIKNFCNMGEPDKRITEEKALKLIDFITENYDTDVIIKSVLKLNNTFYSTNRVNDLRDLIHQEMASNENSN